MRYEVWVKSGDQDVRVYESDIECVARIIVDGAEVYSLTGTPEFEPSEAGFTRILTGGTMSATVQDAKGKPLKVMDKVKWSP